MNASFLVHSPPMLAFGFASPLLLWGAALGAVPIVLHLLHRRRHRETTWAAMRFLVAAVQKNQRRLRLEQLLLLALRALMLVLLAVALSQPFAESFGRYFQANVPIHRLIVIDASFSLGMEEEGGRRFDRARQIAREIVAQSRQGDAINLLRISQKAPRAIIGEPSYQKQQALAELEQIALTEEPGELATTLREALDAAGKAPQISRKEIYFVSDFQSATWRGETQAGRQSIHDLMKKLGDAGEIVLIDVGSAESPNAAIVDLGIEESFVALDRPITLNATMRNFGSRDLMGHPVELYVDGRLAETRKLDLPAGGPARLSLPLKFRSSGDHTLELRMAADRLPLDDRRRMTIPVRDELRVLLVNGRASGKPSEAATWFIEKSLAPTTSRQPWQGPMRPEVISEGELAASDLTRFDCVFLCDVRLITDREASVLRNFVESGGGLVIAPGPNVQADNYNQLLGRDGMDLLPGRIVDRVGDARSPVEVHEFALGNLAHPIVAPFRGNPGAGLESTLTFEYLKVDVSSDVGGRTVLPFSNGDPAIVERPHGRGRVVLFATSADSSWSTWSVQRSFPPLMHETVQFAVSGSLNDRQRLVGENLTKSLPGAPTGLKAEVSCPDGKTRPASVFETGNVASVVFDALDRSGFYELSLGAPLSQSELFAVNVDPRESDLTRIEHGEMRSEVLSGIDFEYRTEWTDSVGEARSMPTGQRGGLTRWLLIVCLALLFIEQLMAWNFAAGLSALVLTIETLLIGAALQGQWFAGLAAVVVLALAGAFWRHRRFNRSLAASS